MASWNWLKKGLSQTSQIMEVHDIWGGGIWVPIDFHFERTFQIPDLSSGIFFKIYPLFVRTMFDDGTKFKTYERVFSHSFLWNGNANSLQYTSPNVFNVDGLLICKSLEALALKDSSAAFCSFARSLILTWVLPIRATKLVAFNKSTHLENP